MIIISLGHLLPATLFHNHFVEIKELRNYYAIFLYNIFWYTEVIGNIEKFFIRKQNFFILIRKLRKISSKKKIQNFNKIKKIYEEK